MKLEANNVKSWVCALALVCLAPLAQAGPLVTNGGFEDGDLGWNVTPNATTNASPKVPYTGENSLAFVPRSDDLEGSASQFVVLSSSLSYDIDFYIKGNTDSVFFSFAGLDLSNFDKDGGPDADGWQHYLKQDFTGSAGGTLSFSFDADPANAYVDDVAVVCVPSSSTPGECDRTGPPTGVPEPGSLFLVGAALAAGALVRRRKLV